MTNPLSTIKTFDTRCIRHATATFFRARVLVDGWSLVAGSLIQSYGT